MNARSLIILFPALFYSLLFYGQSPNKMSFQAVIRNATNNLVINQPVGLRISLLQGSATGNTVYAETHQPVTNANGLITLEIGGGTVISGNFSTLNWAAGPYFVKMETDPAGGSNYTITSTNQLLSVPYAFYAAKAGTTEYQTLSISNDTIFLTNGGFVKLPAQNSMDTSLSSPLFVPGSGVTDIDGNQYPTVIINNKEWMAANLKTARFSNGDPIPLVSDSIQWYNTYPLIDSSNRKPAWCYYNNDSSNNFLYGKLYNEFAVTDTRNVCPTGWHSPKWTDLLELLDFIDPPYQTNFEGFALNAGSALKSTGNLEKENRGWKYPNSDATNRAGFNGLPGGFRNRAGQFKSIGYYGFWWLADKEYSNYEQQYLFFTITHSSGILRSNLVAPFTGGTGFSVRCVRD